jgi:hypothetical protein
MDSEITPKSGVRVSCLPQNFHTEIRVIFEVTIELLVLLYHFERFLVCSNSVRLHVKTLL